MLHVLHAFFFKLTPYQVFRSVFVEEFFQIAVERVHLVDRVHGVVGSADLSENGRAHQLEEAKGSLAIPVTLEIRPPLRQNLMLGILYGAVFLNVGINQLVR